MLKKDIVRRKLLGYWIVLCCSLIGCQDGKPTAKEIDQGKFPQKKVKIKVPTVKTASANMKKVSHSMETVGNLLADEDVIISAEIEGKVKKIFFDKGDKVKKGDLLIQLDDEEASLWVKRSDARLEQARLNLKNAKKTFHRYRNLFKEGVIGKQQYDDTENKLSLAQQEVRNSEAELALAEKNQRDHRVFSPLNGVISERFISVGEFAQKNRESGNNLFNIVKTNPIKLSFGVTDKSASKIYQGQKVLIKVRTYPQEEFIGHIYFLNPKMDPTTKSLRIEALFSNDRGKLRPGMFASVFIFVNEDQNAVFAPEEAVLNQGQISLVYVIQNNLAHRREVVTGMGLDGEVEIISGLKAGELVVTEGSHRLTDGTEVLIQ